MAIRQITIGFGADGANVRIVDVREDEKEAITRDIAIGKADTKKKEELIKLVRELL